MSRKKRKQQPAAEPSFRNSPFAALKSLNLSPEPEPAVAVPKPVTPPKARPKFSEEALFLEAMNGVTRLDARPDTKKITQQQTADDQSLQPTKKPAKTNRKLPTIDKADARTFLQEIEKLQLDVCFQDDLGEQDEQPRPMGVNRIRQLKRGIIQVNRQLDLHGLSREEALDALEPFISSARTAAEKAVLIITGKGLHSVGEPVLQQAVAGWLRDQGRSMITEYAPAPQEMGGGGAFVVFLRSLDKPPAD